MPSTPFTTAELARSAPCLRDLLPPDPVYLHRLHFGGMPVLRSHGASPGLIRGLGPHTASPRRDTVPATRHNDNTTTHTDSPDHRDVEPRGTVSHTGASRFFISGGSDMTTATMTTAGRESELRTAARRHGLTLKDLAALMGVSAGYLSQISTGRRPWTQTMREKAMAVLGEVPGQRTVYRQRGVVTAESSFIRECAREMGMTMQDLAERVGISYGYLIQASRGHRNMGPRVQARVESVLKTPVKVAPAQCANRRGSVASGESSYIRERARARGMTMQDLAERVGISYGYLLQVSRGHRNMGVRVQARIEAALEGPAEVASARCAGVDQEAMWERMNAHDISQNEVARRAGISSGHLSQIMSGQRSPSPGVLKRLHGVLFQRTQAERVMPAEVKVLGWRKGERSGMVVRGAGGPGRGDGGGAVRTGGRVPLGARVAFAFRAGYDGRGRVSVEHVVERDCSAMLAQPEATTA